MKKSLSFFFARRYLFSRKSHSVINIISIVSAISISVPVMAMVILLSIFNGLEGMINSMYNIFDPDIEITAAQGKVFDQGSLFDKIQLVDGVENLSFMLEENVLLEYNDRQIVGVMRGVDQDYNKVVGMDTIIVGGEYKPLFGDMPQATVGRGMAYSLGINVNLPKPLMVYTVGRGEFSPLFAMQNYVRDRIFVGGVFALEAEADSKYVFVPIDFAQKLLSHDNKATSISIALESGANENRVKKELMEALGEDFVVETRLEQNSEFYKIMKYEKWGIYFIILLVLVIASFSLVGSLTMLIIEKRTQLSTLYAMGADIGFVRGVFIREGLLVYLSGAILGLIFGVLFCFAQQHWGFIAISAPTLIINSYPVELRVGDLIGVCASFTLLSYLMARMTTLLTIKASDFSK
ncbi:MAG: FtsX-like permease family protein [Rikenellaceae bacterium]